MNLALVLQRLGEKSGPSWDMALNRDRRGIIGHDLMKGIRAGRCALQRRISL